jgi:glutamate racemase
MTKSPIGVFDSGYGGLTVLREIVKLLPQYDYIYLGDNARSPYGNRSFETVYHYTLECVKILFDSGCPLVILACNTASAKALRSIQQKDLLEMDSRLRVLGVIRPTAEVVGNYSKSGHVGILGTTGTVESKSYPLEIEKFYPNIEVHQEACPMWVPLVENNEHLSAGADFFVKKHIDALMLQNAAIDTILLGCTHYPLLTDVIRKYIAPNITIVSQGEIVAKSLGDYLERHPEMEKSCSKGATRKFITTDNVQSFNSHASIFFGEEILSELHEHTHRT